MKVMKEGKKKEEVGLYRYVHLSLHVHALGEHDSRAGKSLRPGLLRDEFLAEHFAGKLLHLARLRAEMNSTLVKKGIRKENKEKKGRGRRRQKK